MKTKTLLIASTLFVGLLSACSETIKTEEKIETTIESSVVTEVKTEVTNTTTNVEKVDENRKRTLDSLRQVKEHGHAH